MVGRSRVCGRGRLCKQTSWFKPLTNHCTGLNTTGAAGRWCFISLMNDIEAIKELIKRWYEVRQWAEKFLCDSLKLKNPCDILQSKYRGRHQVLDTEWWYRTHGIGVDITKSGNKGGIDFDFDKLEPDEWRLREFMVKQLNDGTLIKRTYRPLLQDKKRFCLSVNNSNLKPNKRFQQTAKSRGC